MGILMTFSTYERLLLSSQYRILNKIDPGQSWDTFAEILENGFEGEYWQIENNIYPPLTSDGCHFVLTILSVYDALQRPYLTTSEKLPGDIVFPGFDGNNETEYLGYFQFLLNQGRFTSLKRMAPDGNSHAPFASLYRQMIVAWESVGSPHSLSGANANAVLDARRA